MSRQKISALKLLPDSRIIYSVIHVAPTIISSPVRTYTESPTRHYPHATHTVLPPSTCLRLTSRLSNSISERQCKLTCSQANTVPPCAYAIIREKIVSPCALNWDRHPNPYSPNISRTDQRTLATFILKMDKCCDTTPRVSLGHPARMQQCAEIQPSFSPYGSKTLSWVLYYSFIS